MLDMRLQPTDDMTKIILCKLHSSVLLCRYCNRNKWQSSVVYNLNPFQELINTQVFSHMHDCLKFLWVISLYGVIFFTFTSITLVTGPQYYDFRISEETKNSNIILVFLFLLLFLILSVKWRRDRNQHRAHSTEIEMKPLQEHHHHTDSIEIQ